MIQKYVNLFELPEVMAISMCLFFAGMCVLAVLLPFGMLPASAGLVLLLLANAGLFIFAYVLRHNYVWKVPVSFGFASVTVGVAWFVNEAAFVFKGVSG